VRLNVRVDEAWSDITVQLKRRADLLLNLIETVKGICGPRVRCLRGRDRGASRVDQRVHPGGCGGRREPRAERLKSIFAVAGLPQLQASQNYLQLQGELVDTEDKIQASRRFCNGGVRELNTSVKTFPNTRSSSAASASPSATSSVADSRGHRGTSPRVQFTVELHVSRAIAKNKRNTVLIILLFLLIIGGLGALAALHYCNSPSVR
jgi:LemA protein